MHSKKNEINIMVINISSTITSGLPRLDLDSLMSFASSFILRLDVSMSAWMRISVKANSIVNSIQMSSILM